MAKYKELCAEALRAIEIAERENLPRTVKAIKMEAVKNDCSMKLIYKRTFLDEAGKERAAEIAIKESNPKWIYWIAKYAAGLSQDTLNKFTQIIIETNDSCTISSLTSDAFGLSRDNINDLASAILKLNRAGSAMCFAKYVSGISLELKNQLAEIVLASKDPMWAYFFAEGVVGISNAIVERFANVVIDSKNPRYAYLFAKFIAMRLQKDTLDKLILTVKNGDDKDLGYFGGRTVKDLYDELEEVFKK